MVQNSFEKTGIPKEEKEVLDLPKMLREEALFQIKELIKTPEDLADFEEWRKIDQQGREARQLRKITEIIAAAKLATEKQPEKKEEIAAGLLELLNLKENISSRPRTEQFFGCLIAEILGLEKPKVRKEVEKLISGLRKAKSTEGELNAIELLSSSKIGFGVKREWLLAQFLPRLSFLLNRDLEEAKKIPPLPPKPPAGEPPPPGPELPPPDQDFLRPSIEEMEKREGEPSGYFVVFPFYGGYWKEKTFDEWDSKNLCFRAGLREIKEAEKTTTNETGERAMSGFIIGNRRTPLPRAYNFAPKPETLRFPEEQKIKILEDEERNYLLETEKEGLIPFTVFLAKRRGLLRTKTPQVLETKTGRLSEETERFLVESKTERISNLEKARKLKRYVRNLLKYPEKGDSRFNEIYCENPEEFFQRIEQFKKADCDVANSFFIALLSRLEIPARLAVGHYVKVKDHKGQTVLSSGTRHAWAEVWDPTMVSREGTHWHCQDATPEGAPEMDEEETDERQEDENLEGDFGEIEAKILSDEKLKEMIEGVKKIQEEKKQREKSPEEIRALNFSQEAGCSAEEAKQILKEIEKARELKDSKGRKILDLLSKEFMKIIKENLKEIPSYRAPVRLPEGDELEEPVEAWIDIKTGEAEPGGFKKHEKKTEKVQEYGGFDMIFVKDKSGSMAETDPLSGKIKYKEQQLGNFLLNESLHRFSHYAKGHRIKLFSPLDIRFSDIGFQANGAEAFLPLTDKWGPKEQLTVWKKSAENIGGGTPDNLGLRAARQMIEEDIKKQKKEKKRLRMVIVLADGGTDSDKVADREQEKQKLQEMGVVVAGLGLTEAASAVKAAYYPNGDYVKSVLEMPEWVAEKIINQAKKLYPTKIKR